MTDSKDDKDDRAGKRGRMDRRQFGKILVAGVGGLTLGKAAGAEECKFPAEQRTSNRTQDLDVIIVGAGLSGLIAARELKRAGKSVLVLEANSYVGGRMVGRPTKAVQGGYLDYGGQWVGETQYEMIGLAAELKIPLFPSYEDGRSIQSWNGFKSGFNGNVAKLLEGECEKPDPYWFEPGCKRVDPNLPDCLKNDAEANIWNQLLAISQRIPAGRPWATSDAIALDGMTFQDWLGTREPPAAGYTQWLPAMQAHIGGSGGFEPKDVSLLHMAWTQCVGPQSETPEKWLLCGGAGQIPERLAKELENEICVDRRVTSIQPFPKNNLIQVVAYPTEGDRIFYSAKAVIVAIPPSMREKIPIYIDYKDVPSGYDEMVEIRNANSDFGKGSQMGSISKVHAVYSNAFWRCSSSRPTDLYPYQCLSGSAAGNLKTCEFIVDSSPPSGRPGILTSFIGGARNNEIIGLSEADVQELVLQDFEYYFGPYVREGLKEFCYCNWNKQWSGGAFTTYLGKDIWTHHGEKGWRTPIGNIFWAGTETSDRWPGYFDGAVRAGRIAAMAVLERLAERIFGTPYPDRCLGGEIKSCQPK